jgi:hypothetical protein
VKSVRSLARPLAPACAWPARLLALRARELARVIVQRAGASGTLDIFHRLSSAERPETFGGVAWRPQIGLGQCRPFTRADGSAPLQLLSALVSSGLDGSWQLDISSPEQLFIGGTPLLVAGDVRIVSSSQGVSVNSDLRPVLHVGREALGIDVTPTFVHGPDVRADSLLEGRVLAPAPGAAQLLRLRDALDLLSTVGPHWRFTILWVYRALFLVDCEEGSTSGSSPQWVGASFFGGDLDTEQFALLLVHEAAHQCMNLVCAQIDLSDPEHRPLYYSTLKRMPRPLGRVLYALHACCWMRSYLVEARRLGRQTAWWRRSLEEMEESVRAMTAAIQGSVGLTNAGAALVDALADDARVDLLVGQGVR